MIFNTKVAIYQSVGTFIDGEVSSGYSEVGDFWCHLKFTGDELMSGDRKKDIRRGKLTFESSPVALNHRDVIYIVDTFYRLLYPPTTRTGLSGRPIYEVEFVETGNIEVI